MIEESHQAKDWGIEFAAPKIDLARLRSFKENVIKKLTGGLGILSKQRKVHYVQGRASFENSTTLKVKKSDGAEETLTFDRIIIATGSRPAIVRNTMAASLTVFVSGPMWSRDEAKAISP